MDCCSATRTCLIFLAVNVHLALAATHSLQYFYTAVTPGIDFPEFTVVGLLDDEQIDYYDSNIKKMISKTEWMEKNADVDYWNTETEKAQAAQENFKMSVGTLMQRHNHTGGVHTVQRMYGCELNDDGTKRGYRQEGYDGDDFLNLDLKTLTWTAANAKAVITKHKWEKNFGAAHVKAYLENDCIDWLKKYLGYGRSTLERKVPPEVSLFQKDSSSPVVCHATGFFPKSVMIYWQKNGEDLDEDVEIRVTLPNQDGTFQKRSVLTVSPEELNRNQYTCIVQHSSLEKEIRLQVSDRRVLSASHFLQNNAAVTTAISSLSTALNPGVLGRGYLGVICTMILLALGLIISGGVFIWMRKKSDFKPVSGDPKSPSGEDSLFSNAKRPLPSC